MGHRMILKKCFAVAGRDKARTSLMNPSWSGVPLPTEGHGLLQLSLNLHWPKRTAVKSTTSLVKTFYHEFFNKFDRLLTLNTKNFTGKLISVGEKRNKVWEKKWNAVTSFPLLQQFRRGKISSETKHIGTGITFFLF